MKRLDEAIKQLRIKNMKGVTMEEMDNELYQLGIMVFEIMDEQQRMLGRRESIMHHNGLYMICRRRQTQSID